MSKLSEPSRGMIHYVRSARQLAWRLPPYSGFGTPQDQEVITRCRAIYRHGPERAVSLTFTRDGGMHTSGWWKNPDYERALHLSAAFWWVEGGQEPRRIVAPGVAEGQVAGARLRPAPHDHELAALWCQAFFGDSRRLLWIEPPFSPEGKRCDVYHYRLFVAPDWRTPLLPRGEVYTREFTEAGWKSWSDLEEPRANMETPP